jgi:hypothetical protein
MGTALVGRSRARAVAAVAVGSVLAVAVGSGCARDAHLDLAAGPPGFAADPEYVTELVEAADAEAYRFSMSVSVVLGGPRLGGEFATGAVDGDESSIRLDPSAMLTERTERDISWELVTTDEAMYIRYPPEAGSSDEEGMLGAINGLDGDWGRIDFDQLDGITPREMEHTVNDRREGDPRRLLELLSDADAGAVDDLGYDVVGGVRVTGLSADVDLQAVLDTAAMGGIPDDLFGSTLDMSEVSIPLEAWVDDEGRIRRLRFFFGAEAVGLLGEANDVAVPAGAADLEITMLMDLSDHGDSSIDIETPPDTVDATEAFVAAYHHENGTTPDTSEPDDTDDTTTTTEATTTTTTATTATTRPQTGSGPDGEPFFAADFSSDQDWGPADGGFGYRSGRLVAHVGAGAAVTSYAPAPPFPVTGSFRIDVDVENLGSGSAAPAPVYGIECGQDRDDGIVDTHQATIGTDSSWLMRWANGIPDHLEGGVFTEGVDEDLIKSQGPTHLTLEVRNSGRDVRFRFLVNGREVTAIIEQVHNACGLVGLVADAPAGSPGLDVAFDNLVVTSL